MLMKELGHKPFNEEQNLDEPAPHFTVLSPAQFAYDFQIEGSAALNQQKLEITSANYPDEMGMEAMYVEFYGREPRAFFDIFKKATKQGFHTEIHEDGYSGQTVDNEFLLLHPFANSHRQWVFGFTKKRFKLLEQNGARIVETNPVTTPIDKATFLLTHKDHKKIFYITYNDSAVAWTGGMNLARVHFDLIDCMVKIKDPKIVEALIKEFKRTPDNVRTVSEEVECTKNTSLLVDTGRDKSVILEKAIEDIDCAKDTIFVTSAFHPRGAYLAALDRARKRGVHVAYITSNPSNEPVLLRTISAVSNLTADIAKTRIPLLLPEKQGIHAKMQIVDEKVAIFGSHNFVNAPHEELSLRSTDPTLVRNLVAFMKNVAGENLRRPIKADLILPA